MSPSLPKHDLVRAARVRRAALTVTERLAVARAVLNNQPVLQESKALQYVNGAIYDAIRDLEEMYNATFD